MKIFNFTKRTSSVRNEICIPIAANDLQEAYELFFKSEGYTIEVDTLPAPDDKDQFKLFDMDALDKEWNKEEEWEPI
jgi:hypothetical protein